MDSYGAIPDGILSSMLLKMFHFSPIAMSISTSDGEQSRYLMVNQAYLDLTGSTWEAIAGKRLIKGAAIPSPGFDRRHQTLREVGSYVAEEVNIRHVDGTVIPTLISCQRTIVGGINYDLEILVDISDQMREQHRQITQLLDLAQTDALSGLPNRRAFENHLEQCIAAPMGGGIALAYLDLNGFKQLNDGLGHAAGDQALKVLSARMKGVRRAEDFVARIGGDEFALIIRRGATATDEMIMSWMERVFQPFEAAGQTVTLGASVGVSRHRAGESAEALVNRADKLMYEAKRVRRGGGIMIRSDLEQVMLGAGG